MASHQLDDADAVARALRLDVCAANHVDGRRECRLEPETSIDEMDVVVDGLWDAHDADRKFPLLDLGHDRHGASHGSIAADDEKDADAHPLEGPHHLDRILTSARSPERGPSLVVNVRDE